MKCSICGTESKADARQCERCGAALVVPTFDKTMLLDVRAFRAAQQSGEAPVIRPMASSAPATTPVVTPAPAPRPDARPPTVAARSRPSRITLVAVTIILGIVAFVVYQLAMTLYSAPAVRVVAPAASRSATTPAPGRPNAAPVPAQPATGR